MVANVHAAEASPECPTNTAGGEEAKQGHEEHAEREPSEAEDREEDEERSLASLTAKSAEREAFSLHDLRALFDCRGSEAGDTSSGDAAESIRIL